MNTKALATHSKHFQSIIIALGLSLLLGCAQTKRDTISNKGTWTENKEIVGTHRQMTFEGPRAGEGYFSPDGQWMIFQSEREKNNPFYQIYLQDLSSKKTWRVSTGTGKTTCAWIAPDKKRVIFSSTHEDPNSLRLQQEEMDFRASGQTRRYSWDYDPNYDIFESDPNGQNIKNLTKTRGYDAESSISPDGRYIVFASNRSAYEGNLTPEDQERLQKDPAYFMELYIMDRSGRNVRRLTNTPGYDGGPFFSPNGQQIVWRRFTPDGRTAEIYTMNRDGSEQKRLTQLNAMSWAPFYHPSGDYIVFTSNILGYHNFELFIVDTKGTQKPVRVSFLDGFDGLPVFTPDGRTLTWNRKLSATDSQIVTAPWNDELARRALQLPPRAPELRDLTPAMNTEDMRKLVSYLASPELKGRATGSDGEEKMNQMIRNMFKETGLQAAPGTKDYLHSFPFFKHARLGQQNELFLVGQTQTALEINKDWRPLSISKRGGVSAAPIVFAGYGLRAPNNDKNMAYDSYQGLDVNGKWVLIFRYSPENVTQDQRLHLQRYARLEHKAIIAKDLGARGVIIVNGPEARSKEELIPFRQNSATDLGIPVITFSDAQAQALLKSASYDLKQVQKKLDNGENIAPFEIQGTRVSANIDILLDRSVGNNVLGMIRATPPTQETVVVGAHGDHLGDGPTESSLRHSGDKDHIHYGADDNASGVSAVLRVARMLSEAHKKGEFKPKRNIIFAVWSGEEMGNLGSSNFVKNMQKNRIKPTAYINMDMIGRWEVDAKTGGQKPLAIQGVGSAKEWKQIVEKLSLQFSVQLQEDPYLPTDAMAFYTGKVPVINFFTGAHKDYHTPRDTAEKINYAGLITIAATVQNLATMLATTETLTYQDVPKTGGQMSRGFRIFLGTIPDYTEGNKTGVKLSGVITGGPAEKAGLKTGDVIVEFSNKKISNIHDYVFSLETLRPNETTTIVVLRNGQKKTLPITPEAKE